MKKLKKTIAYLLALTCCFSVTEIVHINNCCSVTAHAETEKTYENWSYIVYDKIDGVCDTPCIEITKFNASGHWDAYIPEKIDGLPVVSVSGVTFSQNLVSRLNIPSSVKRFDKDFLRYLRSSCLIIIDNEFEFSMNFSGNSSSTSGQYNSDNMTLESFSLTYVYPPHNDANNKKVIKDIEIPETVCGFPVTSIEPRAFADNQNIRSVKIPDTVEYFGNRIFANSSLQSVNIPKSLKVLPSKTFLNCEQLKSVDFPENLIVAKDAFYDSGFKVPNNLILSSNTAIENSHHAVSYNTSDYSVKVSYDDNNRCYTSQITYDNPDYLLNKSDLVIPEYENEILVTSVIFSFYPAVSDTEINLDSISYPSTITSIDNFNAYTESNSIRVKKIIINNENSIINQNAFKNNTDIEEVIINSSCKIKDNAFYGCTNLKKVTFIGDNPVIKIEHDAFRKCNALETVIFPENMTADFQIDAFRYCSALKKLNLSGKINVSSHAFRECDGLETLTLNGDITLNTDAFSGCGNLSNIIIDKDKAINGSAFNGCPNLLNINSVPVFNTDKGVFNAEINDFVFSNFNSADDVGFINLYIMEQANKFVEKYITDDMSDMQKIKTVHDWICENTSYDSDNVSARKNHNDASVFMNGTSVCEGYARGYNILLNASGIETYYLLSDNHAWNVVRLGGHYFHSDTTWDDGDIVNYDWFLKSDSETLSETDYHSVWNFRTPSTLHNFQKETLPECRYSMGDINTDGSINIADLVTLNKYLTGRSPVSADDIVLADLTFDGVTDVFDLVCLRQLLLKK